MARTVRASVRRGREGLRSGEDKRGASSLEGRTSRRDESTDGLDLSEMGPVSSQVHPNRVRSKGKIRTHIQCAPLELEQSDLLSCKAAGAAATDRAAQATVTREARGASRSMGDLGRKV